MPASKLYQALRLRREKGWLAVLSARALRVDDVLLEHYNWREGRAFPGYETLCRDTGLGKDAVREALRELAFYRRWEIARRPRRPNVYRLPPELVPNVPAVRYIPSARWTRREHLVSLERIAAAGEVEGVAPMKSRASHSMKSRVSHSYGRDAPHRNYAVELRSVNYEENYVEAAADFQSHPQDKDQVQNLTHRYRSYWLEHGGGEEIFPGVRRALAAALRVDEEVAGDLLRHGPQ